MTHGIPPPIPIIPYELRYLTPSIRFETVFMKVLGPILGERLNDPKPKRRSSGSIRKVSGSNTGRVKHDFGRK